jgi:pyruvate/2-oxoglutarate dehydrogenase complex dihydrolipoamide acyltransferase (E2) component
MNTNTLPYHVVELTPGRRAWINAMDLSGPTHWMYGLLEVDVTVAQQFIAERKARTGEALSFTGFLVFCLARAVDENREVQAYLKGRKQIIMFDDVNVGVMIEHKNGEKTALMGHIVQGAERRHTARSMRRSARCSQHLCRKSGHASWFHSAMLLPAVQTG